MLEWMASKGQTVGGDATELRLLRNGCEIASVYTLPLIHEWFWRTGYTRGMAATQEMAGLAALRALGLLDRETQVRLSDG